MLLLWCVKFCVRFVCVWWWMWLLWLGFVFLISMDGLDLWLMRLCKLLGWVLVLCISIFWISLCWLMWFGVVILMMCLLCCSVCMIVRWVLGVGLKVWLVIWLLCIVIILCCIGCCLIFLIWVVWKMCMMYFRRNICVGMCWLLLCVVGVCWLRLICWLCRCCCLCLKVLCIMWFGVGC